MLKQWLQIRSAHPAQYISIREFDSEDAGTESILVSSCTSSPESSIWKNWLNPHPHSSITLPLSSRATSRRVLQKFQCRLPYISPAKIRRRPKASRGMSAIRIIRPLKPVPRSMPALTRLYTTNVPIKSAPPGTLSNPTPESPVDKIIQPFSGGYHSQGTSVARTIRNIWKAGLKRAFWQIKEMNDTKVGTLIGADRSLPPLAFLGSVGTDCGRLGNRYYEEIGELPLRERWVEYAEPHEYDSTQIEPGWYVPGG